MHDKLTQRCGALVAVPAMNHKQTTNVLKLSDGEVCGQRRLLPFLFGEKNKYEDTMPLLGYTAPRFTCHILLKQLMQI